MLKSVVCCKKSPIYYRWKLWDADAVESHIVSKAMHPKRAKTNNFKYSQNNMGRGHSGEGAHPPLPVATLGKYPEPMGQKPVRMFFNY